MSETDFTEKFQFENCKKLTFDKTSKFERIYFNSRTSHGGFLHRFESSSIRRATLSLGSTTSDIGFGKYVKLEKCQKTRNFKFVKMSKFGCIYFFGLTFDGVGLRGFLIGLNVENKFDSGLGRVRHWLHR